LFLGFDWDVNDGLSLALKERGDDLFDAPSTIWLDGFPVDEGGVSESGISDRQVAVVKHEAVS
jgi:hypothetical protein